MIRQPHQRGGHVANDADRGCRPRCHYFGKSDGGYYVDGTICSANGAATGRARLGLTGTPEFKQFERLLHGLDPHTGKQLTALLTEDRHAGWDFTASLPKGVTTALEGGDTRIRAGTVGGRTRSDGGHGAAHHHAGAQGRAGCRPRHRQHGLARRRASRNAADRRGRHARLGPPPAFRRRQPDERHGRGASGRRSRCARSSTCASISATASICACRPKLAELGYEIETKRLPDGPTAAGVTTPGTSRRHPAMSRLAIDQRQEQPPGTGNRGRGTSASSTEIGAA